MHMERVRRPLTLLDADEGRGGGGVVISRTTKNEGEAGKQCDVCPCGCLIVELWQHWVVLAFRRPHFVVKSISRH